MTNALRTLKSLSFSPTATYLSFLCIFRQSVKQMNRFFCFFFVSLEAKHEAQAIWFFIYYCCFQMNMHFNLITIHKLFNLHVIHFVKITTITKSRPFFVLLQTFVSLKIVSQF